MTNFSDLVGKTLLWAGKDGDHKLAFLTTDGLAYSMHHEQDCCENVVLEDVNGDWSDILLVPILVADERTSNDNDGGYESVTWTFYTIRTIKGSIDLRWCGSSNGYYSESVQFDLLDLTQAD